MGEKRFPIHGCLTISWTAAEDAYRGYSRMYGASQTMERLAERGGFGLLEFVRMTLVMRGVERERALFKPIDEIDAARILAAADIRRS